MPHQHKYNPKAKTLSPGHSSLTRFRDQITADSGLDFNKITQHMWAYSTLNMRYWVKRPHIGLVRKSEQFGAGSISSSPSDRG
ncbi:hypothetical protein AVEN_118769-1 [Araneus ventricosus]|uniref:Uncharacterized protein n=1 Tax=Araneus ventricosus TaxID=182803 RepID=A0A4Y2BVL0_ARAVE|nr:hypothetical protein AVEN_118769-1 [Araneus ventricosus]